MCGILGTVNIPFGSNELNILKHRGPDDEGIERLLAGENIITLGHRRLSIVDLSSAGHQPMVSHCGNLTIIFNGEIYNHLELRERLSGIKFQGYSDTETIVNYLSKFGKDSVRDFNGIFSFALFDKKENTIYLARDRFGVKPLYFSQEKNKFIFSSEIKAIRSLSKGSTVSMENLALLLRLRYCPSPHTLFCDIFKVRPGHVLKYNINTNEITHSHFIQSVSINKLISFDEATEQYGYFFEQAVKRQLMADVDVGILLSGGLDSALITKIANKYHHNKFKTFTVGFEENCDENELRDARETSNLLGTEHHEVIISSQHFNRAFSEITEIIEEPLGTTSTIPLYYLNEVVKKHVKVVLTGQGADEPLGGYFRYQAELFYNPVLKNILRAVNFIDGGMFFKNEKIRRACDALSESDTIKRFDKTYALFTYPKITRLIGTYPKKSTDAINYFYTLLKGNEKHGVEAIMSNDLRMNLSDDLLLLGDKISMHFSIESRVPFLDNQLVKFLESLPYQYRLKIGKGKIIHKKFAEKHFPKSMVHKKKKGFNSPTELWFKDRIGQTYLETLCSSGNTFFSSYFDLKEVRKVFDQHINGGINREKQIFTLVSIYHWLEKNHTLK